MFRFSFAGKWRVIALPLAAMLTLWIGVSSASARANVIQVSSANAHTCVATAAGRALCWGYSFHGELGTGSTNAFSTATAVNGLTGVTGVAVGQYDSCAVAAAAAYCWGYNASGQIGDNTTTDRSTPVQVSGLTSGIASVATGDGFACSLSTAGAVKCWGANSVGQVGDGTTIERHTPVQVSGLTSGVASISAGGGTACAVTTAGAVKCWGSNQFGQIGDGTTTNRSTPTAVSGISSGATSVAVTSGGLHVCAVVSGAVKCWGHNPNGELGNGTTTDSSTPVQVTGLTSLYTSVGGSDSSSCATAAGSGVKCWGLNTSGQLGTGNNTSSTTPVTISTTSGAIGVTGGASFTCLLTRFAGVKCSGYNSVGQLGQGGPADGTGVDTNTMADAIGFAS